MGTTPAQPAVATPRPAATDEWSRLTEATLQGLETCDPVYRPTNFWGPGVRRLLGDLDQRGLPVFKSWPTAHSWFYPVYGNGFNNQTIGQTYEFALTVNPIARKTYVTSGLNGSHEARRDFDAVRLSWDQQQWPFDLTGFGESRAGNPPQRYRFTGDDEIGWGRPYLNYLLCLAALSHHVDEPPTSFLEIGGGYGVLGEIVMQRNPDARYVNLDIPPLLTVSSYYLTTLFGKDRVRTPLDLPADGPVTVGTTGCLPNWRVQDVEDTFDVFLNSFSFQEMEPDVVEHYIDTVTKKDVQYAVSLNSIQGKPTSATMDEGGVVEQVKSSMIIEMFEARGFRLCATYRDPLIISAGEIAVLKRAK